jgi:hypothetical protein
MKGGSEGITRIKIQSGWKDWRTDMSERYAVAANKIYRKVFDLTPGVKIEKVSRESELGQMDAKQGIDLILRTEDGECITVQEKYLDYPRHTLTIEEKKGSGDPGGWYYTTAKYYFVGYVDKYRKVPGFSEYILVDLDELRKADSRGEIQWEWNQNQNDGRRATFRFIDFDKVPASAIVSRSKKIVVTQPTVRYGRVERASLV